MAKMPLDRLRAQLLTTGLQQQNFPLYQVINELIKAIGVSIDKADLALSGGGSGGPTGIDELIPGSGIEIRDMPGGKKVISSVVPIGDGGGEGGEDGPPGPPGRDGISIIGPQGSPGNSGMPGLDGIDGDEGVMGPVGPMGPQGLGSSGASGHMFNDNNETTITISAVDTFVEVDAGFSAGQLDGFTFDGTHRIVCGVKGKYLLVYSVSLLLSGVANRTFEATIMINGVASDEATNHAEISPGGAGRPAVISGNMTADLEIGDEISIAVSNHDDTTDVVVAHANVSAFASSGPIGPQGIQGIIGPDGIEGEQGEDGLPGSTGPIGPIGPQGIPGINGIIGPPGIDAEEPEIPYIIPGPQGTRGNDGIQGINGIPGPPGLDAEEPEIPYIIPGPMGPQGPAGGGGGSATIVEVNLGAVATWRGRFTITDAAITGAKKILCWQAPGPYTGKGTRADEAEIQPVSVISVVPLAGSAIVDWQTPPIIAMRMIPRSQNCTTTAGTNVVTNPKDPQGVAWGFSKRIHRVRGNVKFNYLVFS